MKSWERHEIVRDQKESVQRLSEHTSNIMDYEFT